MEGLKEQKGKQDEVCYQFCIHWDHPLTQTQPDGGDHQSSDLNFFWVLGKYMCKHIHRISQGLWILWCTLIDYFSQCLHQLLVSAHQFLFKGILLPYLHVLVRLSIKVSYLALAKGGP